MQTISMSFSLFLFHMQLYITLYTKIFINKQHLTEKIKEQQKFLHILYFNI